jgi:hypothetical protein
MYSQNYQAKEYSKEETLYKAKKFVFSEIIGSSNEVVEFEAIPLAAANSGELTTLLFKCEAQQKEGLVLGFYGSYWNPAGVIYQGYNFKYFEKEKAMDFLNKIQESIENHLKFLKKDSDNNNIYLRYDDMDVLIWNDGAFKIRLFWGNYDATWEQTAFERSKRRFEKKTK